MVKLANALVPSSIPQEGAQALHNRMYGDAWSRKATCRTDVRSVAASIATARDTNNTTTGPSTHADGIPIIVVWWLAAVSSSKISKVLGPRNVPWLRSSDTSRRALSSSEPPRRNTCRPPLRNHEKPFQSCRPLLHQGQR